MINTNLPAILHRLRDIAFEMSKNRYIWLPLLRLNPLPPTEGFPWDDAHLDANGWPMYQTANKN